MSQTRCRLLAGIVIAGLGLFTTACGSPTPSILNKIENSHVYEDAEGNPDAGIRVTLLIENQGAAGPIRADVKLFCSEGTYERHQTVDIRAEDTIQLFFDFPEPTIWADNVQTKAVVRAAN